MVHLDGRDACSHGLWYHARRPSPKNKTLTLCDHQRPFEFLSSRLFHVARAEMGV